MARCVMASRVFLHPVGGRFVELAVWVDAVVESVGFPSLTGRPAGEKST